MSHEQAKTLLDKAGETLSQCQKDLEEGNVVSLQNFDDTVRELCDVVQAMPQEEAQQYQESLVSLGGALQALSHALTKRRDVLKSQIEGLNVQSKAQAAYKQAPGYSQSGESEE